MTDEKKVTRPIIYDAEFVEKECLAILDEIIAKPSVVLLGELFQERKYSRQRFSEWAEAFKEVDEISDAIKKIKEILEDRINLGGLKNSLNPKMVCFNLQHNYNWKETQRRELTGAGGGPIETKKTYQSVEELEAEMKERGLPPIE